MAHVRKREKGRKRGRGEPGAAARKPKVQKGWVIKMSGLYGEDSLGEGQLKPWARELRVEGRLRKPYPIAGKEWGCLKNLVARPTLDMLDIHLSHLS